MKKIFISILTAAMLFQSTVITFAAGETGTPLSLPINDDFTGYSESGTLPEGWEAASGAASVIKRDAGWSMPGECLKIISNKTATRKFNPPRGRRAYRV